MKKNIKKLLKDADKKTLTVYLILRFLVIITMIFQFFMETFKQYFYAF